MVRLKGNKEIGEGMNKIIAKLAEANELKGVIDVADFNNEDKLGRGKEMVDRLSNLVSIFEDERLDFSKNRAEGDDLLGDAYEYLMRNFATESGKSKGQFYTPAEVSRVIARVIGTDKASSQDTTIYDPTCGSGSLLLKGADEAPHGLTIYGQEKDNATAAMAKMNMILHENPTAEIWQGDTLSSPHWKDDERTLKRFDFVVANPPFSTKSWMSGFDPEHDLFNRFVDGIPPKKNGDYAFVLHILASMKTSGKGAVVMPHGVLFRGNAEGEIRRNIITRGYIKGIISLPANLFYGTSIPACILVLDKEHAASRRGIIMIDASKGFIKDGNKNRLRHQDIRKIVDAFNNQLEIPGYSRMVPMAEIRYNDFNLNIPRYIDSSEPEVIQDIEAHLKGGIPNRDIDALDQFWQLFPSLKAQLFDPIPDRPTYSQLKVETSQIRQVMQENAEYQAFSRKVEAVFDAWWQDVLASLALLNELQPRKFIDTIAESLLQKFSNLPLLEKYDVYQHLMDYWTQTMQDDAYMIASDGWVANPDLIPSDLLVQSFFEDDQDKIERLEEEKESLLAEKSELEEEHSGEEGLLEEVKSDSGNISKTNLTRRIKDIAFELDYNDELQVLQQYLDLLERESIVSVQIKQKQIELDTKVQAKYPSLIHEDVTQLVVEDKWQNYLNNKISAEIYRIMRLLNNSLVELSSCYEMTLVKLTNDVNSIEGQVGIQLKKMGFTWG